MRLLARRPSSLRAALTLSTALLVLPAQARAEATDPGPRAGPAAAGGPLPSLTQAELDQFNAGQDEFADPQSVSGGIADEGGAGLGPRFNANSCSACHSQPAVGGTSPALNPLIEIANLDGATNVVPWFIVPNGPVREARFKRTADGYPDGGVHDLFTIAGRLDASGCTTAVLRQPDFGTPGIGLTGQGGSGNIIFRIPTPVFGAGLIEAIPDATLVANLGSYADVKQALGISGRLNRSGNDGTVTRFGWKAQNKSLLMFAAEAYNVEQGVTSDLFPTERDETAAACLFNALPEDRTDFTAASVLEGLPDVVKFAMFTRFLAPPQPATPPISNGRTLFSAVGCALCHTPSLKTGNADSAALRNQDVNLYSDLALHRMGTGLADGISQGLAAGNEFRTAPLWGVGQRLFFMHDGRTTDLVTAIHSHAGAMSEANQIVANFYQLSTSDQQDLLNFLRSL